MNWRVWSSDKPAGHFIMVPRRHVHTEALVMTEAASLVWLVLGASLIAVVTHAAVPPATWLALTFLLHASRSMPAMPGVLSVWVAVYAALAVGNRGILPVSGPTYFSIIGFYSMTVAFPFALDRFVASRTGGPGS